MGPHHGEKHDENLHLALDPCSEVLEEEPGEPETLPEEEQGTQGNPSTEEDSDLSVAEAAIEDSVVEAPLSELSSPPPPRSWAIKHQRRPQAHQDPTPTGRNSGSSRLK